MKRFLAIILCFCLVMTLLPVTASASVGGTSGGGIVAGGDENTGGDNENTGGNETTGGDENTGGSENTGGDDPEPVVPNGHTQLSAMDGEISGQGDYREVNNSLAGAHSFGWTAPGSMVVYRDVSLEKAKSIEVCTVLDSDDATEDATIGIYLDDETEPVATVTCALGETAFHIETAALTRTVSGTHTVTVKVLESMPDIAWIRFSTEEVKAPSVNGHARMMMIDASARSGGNFEFSESDFSPSYLKWIGTGATVTYDLVNLNQAAHVEMCLSSYPDDMQIGVYVNDETEPVALFGEGLNTTMHLERRALSETLTGQYTITVKVITGEPSISWIRFMSEEEANEERKEIALVGDSNVEYGRYYSGLLSLVDSEVYEVVNYGRGGTTIETYQNDEKCSAALEAAADYYIITLGTNDLRNDSEQIAAYFVNSYKAFIESIKEANPNAKIYAQTPLPLKQADREDGTNPESQTHTETKLKTSVIPAIREACAAYDVPVIDIYNGMLDSGFTRDQFMDDFLHVNTPGGKLMAMLTYDAVFGSLDLDAGTDPGNAEPVTISAQRTELTEKGETITLTANREVYWQVRSMDDGYTTFATIDQNGILTAKKPGGYKVVAISKADTSVKAEKEFYNRFKYEVYELDYIFGRNYARIASGDIRDGGAKINTLSDGITFLMENVDLQGVTSVTARATSSNENLAVDSTLEFHLDAPDGPMLAKCVMTNTKICSWDGDWHRFGDFSSAMVPVTDGALHDVYAVVRFPDPSNFKYEMLSIDFGRGGKNPVVLKGDEVVNPYSENFTWTAGAYTVKSQAENTPIAAFYDEDGRVVASAILKGEGAKEARFTLSEDYPGGTLRTYLWDTITAMQPMTSVQHTYQKALTVGCVGDSITLPSNQPEETANTRSYPRFLQNAVGNRYVVKNFGYSGAKIGDYDDSQAFTLAKEAACDIYVIQLGTNDTKDNDHPTIKEDYQVIIDGLREANPDCVIYLCLPYPVFGENNMGIREEVMTSDIIPAIREIAEANHLPVINVHDQILAHPRAEEFDSGDKVHPAPVGMLYLAEIVKEALLAE